MKHTHERKEQLLRDIAGEFVARTANRTSLITVTRVVTDEKHNSARIFISVLPETQEHAAADFLNRNVHEFKEFVLERLRIGRLPRFTFIIDIGEKNRQRVDELL